MQFLGVIFYLEESSDDDVWSLTLAETKRIKLNPIDELKCFVRQVKKGQSAEHFLITREKSFINQTRLSTATDRLIARLSAWVNQPNCFPHPVSLYMYPLLA